MQTNERGVAAPDRRPEQTDNPAIGLIASEKNEDEVLRCLLRAKEKGHPVFIGYHRDSSMVLPELSKNQGATMIKLSNIINDAADSRQMLARIVRFHGYPGLLFHKNTSEYIDYNRSLSALNDADDYAIETITRPPREQVQTLIAIPAYNEGAAVKTVVEQAKGYGDDVVVIDDGSEDDTAREAKRAGATVIQHLRNKGYGAALKTAFREADKRDVHHLVILDGDGQHDPGSIPGLIDSLEDGMDIVIGSRFVESHSQEMPTYRKIGIYVINLATNLSFGFLRPSEHILDTQSGFRAYSRRAIRRLADSNEIGDGMNASTDILYLARKNGFEVEEVGTEIKYDVESGNSHHPIPHGVQILSNILKIIEREYPIIALGVPGFSASIIGMGFGYWTFFNYIKTDVFPLGLALVSTFCILGGILACFTAVILHALQTLDKR